MDNNESASAEKEVWEHMVTHKYQSDHTLDISEISGPLESPRYVC